MQSAQHAERVCAPKLPAAGVIDIRNEAVKLVGYELLVFGQLFTRSRRGHDLDQLEEVVLGQIVVATLLRGGARQRQVRKKDEDRARFDDLDCIAAVRCQAVAQARKQPLLSGTVLDPASLLENIDYLQVVRLQASERIVLADKPHDCNDSGGLLVVIDVPQQRFKELFNDLRILDANAHDLDIEQRRERANSVVFDVPASHRNLLELLDQAHFNCEG